MNIQLENTQNKRWQEDKSKFGYKMLLKFGWSEGKGLGRNLEGQTTAVKLTKRADSLGLGAIDDKAGNIGWSSTSMSFNSVLAALNNRYGQQTEDDDEEESKKQKKKKKAKKEKKEKKAKKEKKEKSGSGGKVAVGITYKRLTKRTISAYTSEEMRAVLGASASVVQGSSAFTQVSQPAEDSQAGRKRRLSVSDETTTEEESATTEVTRKKESKKTKKKKSKSETGSKKSRKADVEAEGSQET